MLLVLVLHITMSNKYQTPFLNIEKSIRTFKEQIKTDLIVKIILECPGFVIEKQGYYSSLIDEKRNMRVSFMFPDKELPMTLNVTVHSFVTDKTFIWKFLETDIDTFFEKKLKQLIS